MKLVVLNEKVIGKVLNVPIYNTNGVLYIKEGAEISEKHLEKIQSLGITTVYIEDENSDFDLQEVINPVFKIKLLNEIKKEFDNIASLKKIDYKIIHNIVEEIISEVNLSENAFMFNNIGRIDNRMNLAIHSLDVTILSIMLGINRNYDNHKLINLAIGALLHDIGRLVTSDENEHTKAGYKLIHENGDFSPTSSIVALHHHERVDGRGYPERLKGDKIYEFAKIVSICNEYVRCSFGEKAYFPKEVIEKITAETNFRFDPSILQSLTSSVCCYPNGVRVLLTNGEIGTVIKQNKGFPLRPVIKIEGQNPSKYIDLMKCLTTFIIKVIIEAA